MSTPTIPAKARTRSLRPRTRLPDSGNSTTRPALSKEKVRESLASFEHAVGGREALVAALQAQVLSDPHEAFVRILADPRRGIDSLASIAASVGIAPGTVIELFRSGAMARAHAIAVDRMARAVPGVVEDVAKKSVDRFVACPSCLGEGTTVEGGNVCPTCRGKGEVAREADFDRQRLFFESAGLLKKGGGQQVQVNVQQQVGIQAGSLLSRVIKGVPEATFTVSPESVTDVEAEDAQDGSPRGAADRGAA